MLRLLAAALLFAPAAAAQPTAYVGGRWADFDDGVRFATRDTTWAEGGVFVAERPAGPVRVVDLDDAFVVPPFGDGHLHAFYDPASLASQDSLLVARGVFTALNPMVPATERGSVRGLSPTDAAARWRALDVAAFAAAPTPADGALLRGLRHLARGDALAAEATLLHARATVPDSLRPFVTARLADAAEARFDWAAAVRYRAEAGDADAATSAEAGFARFPAARLAMGVPETTVPLDGVAVPATVNGTPVRAIVDSGSPGSGISRALVERLGLRVDTTARGVSVVPSMNLRFDTYAVLIDSVRVGEAVLYNVPATVGWGEPRSDVGADEEIFLGSDVLRYLVGAVRYGYADSTFTLVRDAPPEAPPQFLVEPGTGAPAVPVRVAGRNAVGLVDTGNLASVYLAEGAFELPDAPERVLSGERADGGTWRVELHRLPFQIPGHPDGEHLAYEADYIFSADDPATVILGAPVWTGGTLTLDYANRRVGWEPAE